MSKTFFIFSSILKVKDYCLVYQENPIYNINRFVLQECGKIVEGVWLWRISGGLLTGDDRISFGEINADQINVVQLLRIYWK